VDEALAFVADKFRYRRRKGSDTPYLTHLLAVAALVGEHDGSEEQIVAALLHDTLEDLEDVAREDLERLFGEDVAGMVEALSDTTVHPKPDWRTRKTQYIERLAEEGPWVKLISAADKLHNLRCLLRDLDRHGEQVLERFNSGRADQVWYYRSVVEALGQDWDDPLLEELKQAVACLVDKAGDDLPEGPKPSTIYDSEQAKMFVSDWTGLDPELVERVLDAKFRYLKLAGIAVVEADDDLLRERAVYRRLLPETPDFIDERERTYLACVTGLDEDILQRIDEAEMAYQDTLDNIEWDNPDDRDTCLGAPELSEP
jgi:hypothetical protein